MIAKCNNCKEEFKVIQNEKMIYCSKCQKYCANLNYNKLNSKKEVINMVEEVSNETKSSSSFYVICSKCGKKKFARKEIYEARVKKFGNVE